jgi:DNA-directed RNA polymerase subunit RPC12/RpoP
MATKEREVLYSCPHCGEQITRMPDPRAGYTCPRCRVRYRVMVDEQTHSAAFVDESTRPVREPLGLPRGSIRSVITLAMTVTCAVLVARGQDVPGALCSLLLTIIGFYFGFRMKSATLSDRVYDPAAMRQQPLNLPGGAIRRVLILAFLAMGVFLAYRGRLWDVVDHLELFVILAGLVAGYYFAKLAGLGGSGLREAVGHLKAALGLLMAAVLVFVFISGRDQTLGDRTVVVLCATISFYFGSRT